VDDKTNIGLWWGNLKERDYFEGLEVDGTIVLKLILNKSVGSK
jgi:hypothetical protein